MSIKRKKGVYRTKKYPCGIEDRAYKLCLLGLTNNQLATAFDVRENTIDYWIKYKPKFREAVHKGRIEADAEVATALYKKAIGYSHPDTYITVIKGKIRTKRIIKHYAPDAWAAIKWLTIRQRPTWADVKDINVVHQGNIDHTILQESIKEEHFTSTELEALLKLGVKNVTNEKQFEPQNN